MTSVVDIEIAFNTYFCATPQQVDYAQKYMRESGLGFVFVAVNYPGKQRGVWTEGQLCQTVMDGQHPALWTDRKSGLAALKAGQAGSALFRVEADGEYSLVAEA